VRAAGKKGLNKLLLELHRFIPLPHGEAEKLIKKCGKTASFEVTRATECTRSSYSVRDVSVCACGRVGFVRVGKRNVEKIPDEYRVVVRAADDLKLVELKSKHSTCVLLSNTPS